MAVDSTRVYSNIAVVGTGGYGGWFLKALLDTKHFNKVRAVTRTPDESDTAKLKHLNELRSLGAEVVEYSSRTAESFANVFSGGIGTVVSAVGIAAIANQRAMIDGALAAGVKWFIPSEYGVAHYSSRWLPFKSPLAEKVTIQDYLKQKHESDGLAYTFIYTGLALDYLDPRAIGLKLTCRSATLVGRGGSSISLTSIADVVRLVVDIVQRPDEMQNRTIRFAGCTSKMRDLIKIVTDNDKGQNVKVVSIDDARDMFCALAKGGDTRVFQIYSRLLIEEGLAQINRNSEPLDNSSFSDIAPEPVRDTLKRMISEAEGSKGAISSSYIQMGHSQISPHAAPIAHRSDTTSSVTDGFGQVLVDLASPSPPHNA